MNVLHRVRDQLEELAKVESMPRMEGPADDHGAGAALTPRVS